jgi:prepilin-type processing-associated H-X9-DG protein
MQRYCFLTLFLLVCACLPFLAGAYGQATDSPDLATLIDGTRIPLSRTLKDLDPTWRQMTVEGTSGSSDFALSYSALLTGGTAGDEYYTKGQTVTTGGGVVYLIAYRIVAKHLDISALLRSGQSEPPPPTPLTPDTRLALCLLDLRTAGSLTDIQPFDLAKIVAQSQDSAQTGQGALQANKSQDSDSNLKQIGLAMLQYEQDWDEELPPMQSAAAAKEAIFPYVKVESVFIQPETKQPYQPNTSLSHRSLASFESPVTMVVYFEAGPAADGTRGVLFLDGHVKRIPEAQWLTLRRASHIPGKDPPTPESAPKGRG